MNYDKEKQMMSPMSPGYAPVQSVVENQFPQMTSGSGSQMPTIVFAPVINVNVNPSFSNTNTAPVDNHPRSNPGLREVGDLIGGIMSLFCS